MCLQGFHTVLSDMCHSTTGFTVTDVARSLQLATAACELALGQLDQPLPTRKSEHQQTASCADHLQQHHPQDEQTSLVTSLPSRQLCKSQQADMRTSPAGQDATAAMLPDAKMSHSSTASEQAPDALAEHMTFLHHQGREAQTEHATAPQGTGQLNNTMVEHGLLLPGGNLAVKLLQGSGSEQLAKLLRPHFHKVAWARPKATRSESREVYLVGLQRKGLG